MDLYEPEFTGKCPHCRTAARFITADDTNWNGARSGRISTQLVAS